MPNKPRPGSPTNYHATVAERVKARKKMQRQDAAAKIVAGTILTAAGLALFAGIIFLSGVITAFAWNEGVAPAAEALGHDKVGTLTTLNGIAVNFAVAVAGRPFSKTPHVDLSALKSKAKR